jgi:hypothetical protein
MPPRSRWPDPAARKIDDNGLAIGKTERNILSRHARQECKPPTGLTFVHCATTFRALQWFGPWGSRRPPIA